MSCAGCGKVQPGEVGYTITSGCLCAKPTFTDVPMDGGFVQALTPCVDAIRDIYTQLGARTYEVRLIWSKWTGGVRGTGNEYVTRELLLQPTPLISDLASLSKELTAVGFAELGKLKVSQVSPRYPERLLLGEFDGTPIPPDVTFYWEVTMGNRDGFRAVRRRFIPASPPSYNALDFDWSIVLMRSHGDRAPDGLPRALPEGQQ